MIRNNLRRGMTAMLCVAALMVAGAQPAAAEGLGWSEAWNWLSGLWGGITLRSQTSADNVDAGPNGGPAINGDCGFEIDPNGVLVPRCKPNGAASGG